MTGTDGLSPPLSERWICPKCTGVRGVHYLTCPTLSLPLGRGVLAGREDLGNRVTDERGWQPG